MTYRLKWPNLAQHAYTYGTHIEWKPRGVVFSNPQMPPGFVMTSWFSATNFQGDRTQPMLPLLERGRRYRLELVADMTPANSVYLKLSYFNAFGDQMATEILKGGQGDFTYPLEAQSYRIDLVNAGCESISFKELVLAATDEVRSSFPENLDQQLERSFRPIYLVFLEPSVTNLSPALEEELASRACFVTIQARTSDQKGYLDDSFDRVLREALVARSLELGDIHFVGYGPIGNLLALYWASLCQGRVSVTAAVGSSALQLKWLDHDVDRIGEVVRQARSYTEQYPERVEAYGDVEETPDLDLVEEMLDRSELLLELFH